MMTDEIYKKKCFYCDNEKLNFWNIKKMLFEDLMILFLRMIKNILTMVNKKQI